MESVSSNLLLLLKIVHYLYGADIIFQPKEIENPFVAQMGQTLTLRIVLLVKMMMSHFTEYGQNIPHTTLQLYVDMIRRNFSLLKYIYNVLNANTSENLLINYTEAESMIPYHEMNGSKNNNKQRFVNSSTPRKLLKRQVQLRSREILESIQCMRSIINEINVWNARLKKQEEESKK